MELGVVIAIVSVILLWCLYDYNSPKEVARREKIKQERIQFLMDNPGENTDDWEIHKQRMIKSDMSQFKGCHYYVGPRGGWYYINSNGRRTYV